MLKVPQVQDLHVFVVKWKLPDGLNLYCKAFSLITIPSKKTVKKSLKNRKIHKKTILKLQRFNGKKQLIPSMTLTKKHQCIELNGK